MNVNIDCRTIGKDGRTAVVKCVFHGALSLLVRQRKTWPRAAGLLWHGITNIDSCVEALRLVRLPGFTEVAKNNPKFPFKFLSCHYLARGLTVTERASCFLHHYRYLGRTLSVPQLQKILNGDITLREFSDGINRIALTMGLSSPINNEGELSLNLRVNGEIVFLLSFTFVPGRVVRSDAVDRLMISRMQGVRGRYPQIALAIKSLYDIAPCALLLATLQGVATAFGIAEIAAVSAAGQASYATESAAAFESNYDDFFAELGIAKSAKASS